MQKLSSLYASGNSASRSRVSRMARYLLRWSTGIVEVLSVLVDAVLGLGVKMEHTKHKFADHEKCLATPPRSPNYVLVIYQFFNCVLFISLGYVL